MDISVFLAQFFGIYLTITGIGLILKPDSLQQLMQRLSTNRLDVMIGGILTLLVGAPMVLLHNIWDGSLWQTVVTVLAWVTFVKGVLRILMPDAVVILAQKMQHTPQTVSVLLWIVVATGGYLLYAGFML